MSREGDPAARSRENRGTACPLAATHPRPLQRPKPHPAPRDDDRAPPGPGRSPGRGAGELEGVGGGQPPAPSYRRTEARASAPKRWRPRTPETPRWASSRRAEVPPGRSAAKSKCQIEVPNRSAKSKCRSAKSKCQALLRGHLGKKCQALLQPALLHGWTLGAGGRSYTTTLAPLAGLTPPGACWIIGGPTSRAEVPGRVPGTSSGRSARHFFRHFFRQALLQALLQAPRVPGTSSGTPSRPHGRSPPPSTKAQSVRSGGEASSRRRRAATDRRELQDSGASAKSGTPAGEAQPGRNISKLRRKFRPSALRMRSVGQPRSIMCCTSRG